MIIKHLEIKTYEYLGINVTVKINYDKEQLSLVEIIKHPSIPNETTFKDKNWLFSNRTLEYTATWKVILDSMKNAITKAENELKAYKAEKRKEMENNAADILDMATKIVKGKNKKK